MATDRERAASLYREARNAGPGDGPRVVSMIERALSPTDEERKAMREVRAAVHYAERMAADWLDTTLLTDNQRSDINRLRKLSLAALARLDAATGGDSDGK